MVYILDHKSSINLNFSDIIAFAVGSLNVLDKNFIDVRSFYLKNIIKTCVLEDNMMEPKQYLFIQSFRQKCVFFDTVFPFPWNGVQNSDYSRKSTTGKLNFATAFPRS